MSRAEDVAREYWFELLIALLLAAGTSQLLVRHDAADAPSTTLWFTVPAVAVTVMPLFARRRFPFIAPAAYWILAAAVTFVDGVVISWVDSLQVVGLASALLLGNLRDLRKGILGLAAVVAGIVIVIWNVPGPLSTDEYVFISVRFVAAWVAGFALRAREEQAEAAEVRAIRAEGEREVAARIAVAEERARIARELHDVVAHAVSVMVLQVGAVRHKLPDALDEDRDALQGVERTGRTALSEMRRLLAAMRTDEDDVEFMPQPGLQDLDSLLEQTGRAGLPVQLHVDGDPFPLPRAIDLSAYRIVQEGLTNALKHARASRADVTVRYEPDEVHIEVRDDGRGGSTSDGLGHGLAGVRERVKIYRGEMTAGGANGGGFALRARLPLGGDRP